MLVATAGLIVIERVVSAVFPFPEHLLDGLAQSRRVCAADGTMLRGVRRQRNGGTTNSIVMRSSTGTVRMLSSQHDFTRKTGYVDVAG